MLELSLSNFDLLISPLEREIEGAGGPYFDWLHVSVCLETPGIFVKFRWNVMPSELQYFAEQLKALDIQPSSKGIATLTSVEPGVQLTVQSKANGSLIIIYSLQPDPSDGPKLTGVTGADQSYLPSMIAGIDQLICFH
ncbi:hypothetical protein LJR129_002028 [Acidovorax sp. LjRoot129]|uniref:WapI family immunity protein n=1 Tax=Acidovorax sp. LjRoot129 TaxID=3342260 RepID=UPI003ECC37E0